MSSAGLPNQCSTGIAGLDAILCGGLPSRRLYLIQGRPGVGKTTLALQFLCAGNARGETGLYITLSETREELEDVAKSHGWGLDKFHILELSAIEAMLGAESENTFFHPSELELSKTAQILLNRVDELKPARVVLDSLSEFRLLAEGPLRYRRQMLKMKSYFAKRNATVLLLDDQSGQGSDLHIQSLAHGVISLERRPLSFGIERRQLQVEKVRGLKFREGAHDYRIDKGGVVVFPRLIASEHRRPFAPVAVASGIAGFDALLCGGLDRGTSTLFIGPAGCGKSTLALHLAFFAANRGENCEIYIFDESIQLLEKRAALVGIPITEHLQSGRIRVQQVDPAELSPGELTARVIEGVEKRNTSLLIIDSLNGYLNSMPDERFLNLQLHELLIYLNQQGVISIMTVAQHGLIERMESPVDVTYLADTVVLLRFFESCGQLKKAVSVVKKRSGRHEDTIRELRILPEGVHIGEPLINFHGILSGLPVKNPEVPGVPPNEVDSDASRRA